MRESYFIQGCKYLWKIPAYQNEAISTIAARYNVSYPVVQTLLTRGFSKPEEIERFLFTSFEQDVAHPELLKDAQKAVERIQKAIQDQEQILIFGDYDVDGITSTSLMMACLVPLGARVNFYLPHRVKDGYGISTKIVERAAKNGYSVIITVDNGITAFDPAVRAKELGVDLIITDHHRPHDHQPDAYAIVNPNRPECPYPFKVFAGVGVIFKVLSLLYEKLGKEMPPKAYELLLLGTVADVVPLVGENRFWVRHGLHYINTNESLSCKILKKNGNVERPVLTSTDIGFSITPQINALGRLEDPRQGVKFLLGSDETEVAEVGRVLLALNQRRKEVEQSIIDDIEATIKVGTIDPVRDTVLIAASQNWQPGVIGLVASRFVGKYGRPTILFHITSNGIAKGSCRSIPEFNMFNALTQCSDLIDQFGGHSLAAGLALKLENVPLLKARLEKIIAATLTPRDLEQKLALDAHITLPDITKKLVADMDHLEPFGNENATPTFFLENVVLIQPPVLLKNAHVKCSVFADGVIKPIIFFHRPELYQLLVDAGQQEFSVAARVSQNHWNGKVSLELIGLDVSFAERAV